ncbi:cellulose biosynthesis cyclic di-GMP-binding regulatory protein BcsB [Acerihabitans sp. KWT182]|uniref:Cyclic di-GMP-binding protein n=1 Tax=Acerihabitans sp. KWT182 TaxID=3157919 RepID=A0AAU7QFF2_9GAMM
MPSGVQPQEIPFRQPYDAPRWITTRRPASLALNGGDDALTVTGGYHGAIPVAFRAAPDLFMWNEETIPVDINYRFPTASWLDETQSHLSVSMNGVFIRDLPVNRSGPFATLMHYAGFDTREEHATVQLDPYLIYGDNQLAFYFALNPTADAPCNALNNDNIRSRIDPSSTIDLSHAYHFAQLPNLSYFIGASFPFSRQADLAQTLLLLPQIPTGADIQALLDLVARAGNATGVPAAHVRVALGDAADTHDGQGLKDTDILAVGSLAQGDFIRQVLAGSPFTAGDSSLNVPTPAMWPQLRAYLDGDSIPQYAQANRYLSSVFAWRGFVSFPSVWGAKHIVVLATASDDDQLGKIHGDLASDFINSRIRGDVTLIANDNDIHSFQVGPRFASGDLPWYLQVLWYAGQHILALAILGLCISLLLGGRCYVFLKNRAARRLEKGSEHE